jgi:predicted N-acetyltransferase YhbS
LTQIDPAKSERLKHPRLVPPGLSFRLADETDVPALVELGKEQFETSRYADLGIEFSEAQTEKFLTFALENVLLPHLVAIVEGKIVGGISFSYDHSFSKRPIAIMQNLFVTKKYRRTLIGRMLVMMAADIAKDEQACAFFAPVNNNGDHVHSLGNLLAKGGFRMTGYIMSKGF